MIIDTTYLLPLARIAVDKDLLGLISKGRLEIRFSELSVSLISLLELQAKVAKLMLPAEYAIKAIDAVTKALRVIPFHDHEIIRVSFELRREIPDYIDCVIAATAITLKEDLITEDSLILSKRNTLSKRYGIKIFNLESLIS